MKVQCSLSTRDKRAEEQFFLAKTFLGRTLVVSVVSLFATLCFLILPSVVPVNGFFGFVLNYVIMWFLVLVFFFFGYLYMNNGGHISYWSKAERFREYLYDGGENSLVVQQKGYSDKALSVDSLRLQSFRGDRFLVSGSKVFIFNKKNMIEGDLIALEQQLGLFN